MTDTTSSEPQDERLRPGDEAPEGTQAAGEDICPRCAGSGREGEAACSECAGTGRVTEAIGGG